MTVGGDDFSDVLRQQEASPTKDTEPSRHLLERLGAGQRRVEASRKDQSAASFRTQKEGLRASSETQRGGHEQLDKIIDWRIEAERTFELLNLSGHHTCYIGRFPGNLSVDAIVFIRPEYTSVARHGWPITARLVG